MYFFHESNTHTLKFHNFTGAVGLLWNLWKEKFESYKKGLWSGQLKKASEKSLNHVKWSIYGVFFEFNFL